MTTKRATPIIAKTIEGKQYRGMRSFLIGAEGRQRALKYANKLRASGKYKSVRLHKELSLIGLLYIVYAR